MHNLIIDYTKLFAVGTLMGHLMSPYERRSNVTMFYKIDGPLATHKRVPLQNVVELLLANFAHFTMQLRKFHVISQQILCLLQLNDPCDYKVLLNDRKPENSPSFQYRQTKMLLFLFLKALNVFTCSARIRG